MIFALENVIDNSFHTFISNQELRYFSEGGLFFLILPIVESALYLVSCFPSTLKNNYL